MSSHTAPGPLALLPKTHTSCLFHQLHLQLRFLILFVTAIGTAVPGREEDGLWGFGVGSGKGQPQSAASHVRPSLDRGVPAEGTRRALLQGAVLELGVRIGDQSPQT